jgi:hypothetical protein
MAVLLSKFRIDYSDLVIISDVDEAPKKKTKKWFDGLIRPFLEPRTNGMSYSSFNSILDFNFIQNQGLA